MSKLYISEFERPHDGFAAGMPAVQVPEIVTQVVDFSGGVATSLPFGPNTRFLRIETDATCSLAFGKSSPATTGNMRLAGNKTEYFFVTPGDQVSAIANT